MQALAQRRAGLPASTSSRGGGGGPPSSARHHALPRPLRRTSTQRKLRPTILAFAAVPAGVVVEKPDKNNKKELELPLPRAVENAADDPSLHNPLERMERMSTGWFGIIAEYAGVVVEDTAEAHAAAWLAVADEMSLARPLGQTLRRIRGVRDEVVSGMVCLLVAVACAPCRFGSSARKGSALSKSSSVARAFPTLSQPTHKQTPTKKTQKRS